MTNFASRIILVILLTQFIPHVYSKCSAGQACERFCVDPKEYYSYESQRDPIGWNQAVEMERQEANLIDGGTIQDRSNYCKSGICQVVRVRGLLTGVCAGDGASGRPGEWTDGDMDIEIDQSRAQGIGGKGNMEFGDESENGAGALRNISMYLPICLSLLLVGLKLM